MELNLIFGYGNTRGSGCVSERAQSLCLSNREASAYLKALIDAKSFQKAYKHDPESIANYYKEIPLSNAFNNTGKRRMLVMKMGDEGTISPHIITQQRAP